MEYLKLLVISCLLFNVAMAIQWKKTAANCSSDYRLPAVADCYHYIVRIMPSKVLDYDYDSFYHGDVTYLINIHQITKNISLHVLSEMQLTDISLVQQSPNITYIPVKFFYCEETEILTIIFDSELSHGEYMLKLKFTNILVSPYSNGFSVIKYRDNIGIEKKHVMMNFLWNARTVFPCWDEPTLKATFNISVQHLSSYTVLSNMPIFQQMPMNDNTVLTYFYTTPLISPYLVGIVLFEDLVSISNNNSLINMWGSPESLKSSINSSEKVWELQSMYEIAVNCFEYINKSEYFTIIKKMDHIMTPSPTHLMKYSWGLYSYKESDLSYSTKNKVLEKEIYMEYQIAHKVAHQVFRTMVSPTWWSYEPLNDGIATLFGLYFIDNFFGHTTFSDYFMMEIQHQLFFEDAESHMSPVIREVNTPNEIESFVSSSSRKKATAIMRMMSHIVGKEFFMGAINRYWRYNESWTVNLDDLWKAFEGVPMPRHAKFEAYYLDTVMTNWLFNSDYPVVYVDTASNFITITQECFCKQTANKNDTDKLWWIPITYTRRSFLNFTVTSPILWLKPEVPSRVIYEVLKHDWIILNVQQTGYYRVNYDRNNWRKLAAYLNSDEYIKIHPINRAQIIDDSYHLMLKGSLSPAIFLDLSNYLERERDYIPWYPMKKIFSDMSTFFQNPKSRSIKQHMTTILFGVLNDIGYEENDNEADFTKRLRLMVVKLACQINFIDCLDVANAKLSKYLDQLQLRQYQISPSWIDWVLCTGMMKANMTYWEKMLDLFMYTKNIQYLEYLTCVEDPVIITHYLDKLIESHIPFLDAQNSIRIIHSIIRKHATKDMVFSYTLINFSKIRTHKGVSILEVAAQSTYSSELLTQMEDFVKYHTQSMMPIISWYNEVIWWFDENYSKQLIFVINERLNQIQQEINIYSDLFPDLLKIPRNTLTSKSFDFYQEVDINTYTRMME
ncbi:aminopeptidase N-like [Odontomachus brunneus]|uniref:aminopeptidase N-like n=1 Tax=Odontomachus brunneus TaxID=486640 RepID=UPI0013F276A2|nr:aminopeptidase N-like [Odontomachus brunneus]